MYSISPKMLVVCIALAVGPPAGMLAYYGRDLFTPVPIDPRVASGQMLFFTSSGCPACKMMKSVVGRLRNEGFDIRTVDVSDNQDKAVRYGIRAVPTFVLLRSGNEVRRQVGAVPEETLRQMWR